jgi:hypothetical protein
MARRRVCIPEELFLSHSSEDRRLAGSLAKRLQARGVAVWYSRRQLVGAQQWHDEIGKALHRCDWFALLLTPAAVWSRWVKRELLFALNDRRYEDRIVPILARPCRWERLSWTLDALQFVDFEDAAVGYRRLLQTWGLVPDAGANPARSRRRKA